MTDLDSIEIVLAVLIRKSYIPGKYFHVNKALLQESTAVFRSDYDRWYPRSGSVDIDRLFTTPQLIAMLCYRISHSINSLPPPTHTHSGARFSECTTEHTRYAADAYSLLGREIGQIEIFYSSCIGKGFKINHGIGTVIGARCIVGDNCTIHQNCTLGDRNGGRPKIGNNVTIYAGSLILGDITIGDNSIIGANSVVTRSCPAGSVLAGSPAKIIKKTSE